MSDCVRSQKKKREIYRALTIVKSHRMPRRHSFSDTLSDRSALSRSNSFGLIYKSDFGASFSDLYIDDSKSISKNWTLAHWLYARFYCDFKYNRCRERWMSVDDEIYIKNTKNTKTHQIKIDQQFVDTKKVFYRRKCGKRIINCILTIFPPLYESEEEEETDDDDSCHTE